MNALIVGGGVREHAIAWTLRQHKAASRLYAVPGNAGIATIAECVELADDQAMAKFAREERCIVVIGPEAPLANGLADRLRADGIGVVGPSQAAARVESSKAEAKALMMACGIPTARAVVAHSLPEALAALDMFPGSVVVKADGLAQGKGVVVAEDPAAAIEALTSFMERGTVGAAGRTVVLEERQQGQEMSVMALTDGDRFMFLPPARDYKRLGDGDTGPNTGGMGAVAPHPAWSDTLAGIISDTIFGPLLRRLRQEGRAFRGILYAGLMLTDDGPVVLEWNARLGDPEAAVMLPLLTEDLGPYLEALAGGYWPERVLRWSGSAVGVVMAAPGYPSRPTSGIVLDVTEVPGSIVFHASTRLTRDGQVITTGGRSVCAVGTGLSLADARARAYEQVKAVKFPGALVRSDIAASDLRD